MFRRKPPTFSLDATPTPESFASHDWVHGFHYLIRQTNLHFGRDRRVPKEWRPGVSLTRRGAFTLILPATRHYHPDFFRLYPTDYFLKHATKEPPTESYLCYRYEAVPHAALVELGVLRHGLRIQITAWLKDRLGGPHD